MTHLIDRMTSASVCSRLAPAARLASLALAALAVSACDRGVKGGGGAAIMPDSLPVFIGDSLPFVYPPGPYIQRIQDNVTLWLYLDEFGRPVPESTRVHEHAAEPMFDTAALDGARDLVFRPAMKDGKAIPFAVLFPIKFRVPGGPPMPGDSGAPVPKN